MLQYKKLISEVYGNWPSRRPILWLAKWEKLINKAKQYGKLLQAWLQDVCLVWKRVLDLGVYFSQIQINLKKNDIAQYILAKISFQIQCWWEYRKQGLTLKIINKPKSTCSTFNAINIMFDGEAFPKAEDSKQVTAKQEKQKKKTKKPESRNYRQDRSRSRLTTSKNRITANRAVKK